MSNCFLFSSWRSWLRRTTISTSRRRRPTSPTWGLTTPTRSNRSTASTPSTSPWWRCRSASKCLHTSTWVSFAVIWHCVTFQTAYCCCSFWVRSRFHVLFQFVYLNSPSLQTSTAAEVWRFRSAAVEEGSDTRSPTKDTSPNSLSTSTKAGRETSGSSPAEPLQQNKSWTDSSSVYLKNFLLHELPVWSRVLRHVSLWHHKTPHHVNVEEFLVLTSRSTEMLDFLHFTCPDYYIYWLYVHSVCFVHVL